MVATKIYIFPNPDPSSKPHQNYLGQKCNSEFHACLLQWLPRPKDFSAATKSTVSAIKSITRHSPHNNTQHNTTQHTHNKTVGQNAEDVSRLFAMVYVHRTSGLYGAGAYAIIIQKT